MNYLDLNEIQELVFSLKRNNFFDSNDTSNLHLNSQFEEVIIDNFKIILAAGEGAQSNPIHNYPNISEYTHLQVIIMEKINNLEQEAIIVPGKDSRFLYFDWKKYFIYTTLYKKEFHSYIGTRVPTNEVFKIIKDTYKVTRLKTFF